MTTDTTPTPPCQQCLDAGLPSVPATAVHRLLDCPVPGAQAANWAAERAAAPVLFTVGKLYHGRFISDYDSTFQFKVVSRTAKFVTIVDTLDRAPVPKRVGVRMWKGVESCSPFGRYSMSPTLSADRVSA